MTDSTFISGANSGAFKDAFDGLPPWATQETAQQMEMYLSKILGAQSTGFASLAKAAGNAGNLSTEDVADLNKQLEEMTAGLAEENKHNKENQKYWKDEKDARFQNLFGIKGLTTESVGAAATLYLVSEAGEKVMEVLQQSIKTYDTLNASGVNVTSGFDGAMSGFEGLRQATILSGVRFTELAGVFQKHSASVNAVGMKNFASTIGNAKTYMEAYGFSTKESGEALGVMIDSQRGFSDVSNKTQAQLTSDLTKFGKNIFELSMATGMSTSAILSNIESISKSVDANVLSGQIGTEAAEGMTQFLASFQNQDVAHKLLKMMSDPVAALNGTFQDLTKAGFGGFASKMTEFTKSLANMPPEARASAMKGFVDANRIEIDQAKQQASLLAQTGAEGAEAARAFLVGLTQSADAMHVLKPQEIENQMKSNEASKRFHVALENFESFFQKSVVVLTPVLNAISWVLESVTEGLDWLSEQLGPVGSGILAITLGVTAFATAIVAAWPIIAAVGGALWTVISVIGGAIGTVISAVAWIGGAIGTVISAVASIGGVIGTIVASIGSALGTAIALVTSPITIAVAVIGGLAFAAYELYKHFDELKEWISKFTGWISNILGNAWSGAKDKVASLFSGSSSNTGTNAKEPQVVTVVPSQNAPAMSTIDSPSAPKVAQSTQATPDTSSQTQSTTTTQNSSQSDVSDQHLSLLGKIADLLTKHTSVSENILTYTKMSV